MSGLIQELLCAVRTCRRRPWVTGVAVLSLALGIGANTAIFTSVNSVVLNPLPFEDADSVVRIWQTHLRQGGTAGMVSGADFLDWREQSASFEHLAAFRFSSLNLTGAGEPERLRGYEVSPRFFDALRVRPLLGRDFSPEEEEEGRDRVAIVSYGLWQQRFAGDRDILGQTVILEGRSCVVVGIMGRDFDFPLGTDIWVPLAFNPEARQRRSSRTLFVLGRLMPGTTLAQARSELTSIAKRLEEKYPSTNEGRGVLIRPIREVTNQVTDRFLLVLQACAAFVLLLGCVNVASIQLAGVMDRRRELALRAALGGSRWRVARPVLAESVLLGALGGVLGLAMALWGVDLQKAAVPAQVYQWVAGLRDMKVDAATLIFTASLALFAGLLSGFLPAIHSLRHENLNETLRSAGRTTVGTQSRSSLRHMFVVAEVALALVLLVAAGLMVKTFQRITAFEVGYDPSHQLTMNISLPAAGYPGAAETRTYYDQVIERLETLPRVKAAGAANRGVALGSFRVEGFPDPLPGETLPGLTIVRGDYLAARGIPLLTGRLLAARDAAVDLPRVAVISESVARRYWGDPARVLGARLRIGPYQIPELEVIGVVGDVRNWFTLAPEPAVYIANMPQRSMALAIRTAGEPLDVVPAAKAQIRSIDPNLPIYDVKTVEQELREASSGVRLAAGTMAVFAGLALLLAVTGIYGVVSYSVARQTHDIGIRLALGAHPGLVIRAVVGQAMRLSVIGLIVGLGSAVGLSLAMSSALYGVVGLDLWAFVALTIVLALVALGAAFIPARQAARVDPARALRTE